MLLSAPRCVCNVAPRKSRSPAERPRQLPARPAAAAGDDAEVAVFRFTLGSEAADALVPRVVGGVGAAALVVNHLLGGEPSEAQMRAEGLGAALAAVAVATPAVEQRLKELTPGRGRQAAASSVPGATSVFALQPALPEATKQELAWASYALLRNTNICGLVAFWEGRALLARGLVAAPSRHAGGKADAAATLAALSAGVQPAAVAPLYCADRAAISRAGAAGWAGVPEGSESLLAQPLLPLAGDSQAANDKPDNAQSGILLLLSERPRALSSKERAWAAAVAAKLHTALSA